jgi:C-terminal processing protease CtpA/Prc
VVFVVGKDGLAEVKQTLPSSVQSTDSAIPDLQTPCTILIDRQTASAAEVFAAAMKVTRLICNNVTHSSIALWYI